MTVKGESPNVLLTLLQAENVGVALLIKIEKGEVVATVVFESVIRAVTA